MIVHVTAGKIFPTHDFANIDFEVEVSEGATVSNIPSDFTSPRSLTITAEDGSEANYIIIVTGAYGTYSINFGDGSSEAGDAKSVYKNQSKGSVNVGIQFYAAQFSIPNFLGSTICVETSGEMLSIGGEYRYSKFLSGEVYLGYGRLGSGSD